MWPTTHKKQKSHVRYADKNRKLRKGKRRGVRKEGGEGEDPWKNQKDFKSSQGRVQTKRKIVQKSPGKVQKETNQSPGKVRKERM